MIPQSFSESFRGRSAVVRIGNGREGKRKGRGSSALLPVGGCWGDQFIIVTFVTRGAVNG